MMIRRIQKLPRELIYKCPEPPKIIGWTYRGNKNQPALYRMCDTKTGKYVGEMLGCPVLHDNRKIRQVFYPIKKPYKSFYIGELHIEERFLGYGTKFINFAKNLSKQSGCDGRVHLVASRIYDRYYPPHIFYKKCGFVSNNKLMDDYLDNCIASKTQIESGIADNLNMYLPVGDKVEQIQTRFTKFINFLKRFL